MRDKEEEGQRGTGKEERMREIKGKRQTRGKRNGGNKIVKKINKRSRDIKRIGR